VRGREQGEDDYKGSMTGWKVRLRKLKLSKP
jgi:hypothetical protein